MRYFNDPCWHEQWGFMLRLLALFLLQAVKRHGDAQILMGRVGFDDFMVLTSPKKAEWLCQAMVHYFKRLAQGPYSQDGHRRSPVGLPRETSTSNAHNN